ncbi:short chain dehydrogenase [Embleya sp. NPDC127516]|uniref:short chain dehydrogenase n=1 Tax=Embleya sp. NPDC127516 TaxID=3363990 RepID=UPI003826F3E3
MRVIVIGAGGTLGSAIAAGLETRHDVVRVGRRGPVRADLTDRASLDAMFDEVGAFDAVVCAAASGALTRLHDGDDVDYWTGLSGKLIGQVDLVRRAVHRIRDGGSITLTSGHFAEPIPGSSTGYLVNAGLEAFVLAAATEMTRGIRLNIVSPGWLSESLAMLGMDPSPGIPAADVARAYTAVVEGGAHGLVIDPTTAITTTTPIGL